MKIKKDDIVKFTHKDSGTITIGICLNNPVTGALHCFKTIYCNHMSLEEKSSWYFDIKKSKSFNITCMGSKEENLELFL